MFEMEKAQRVSLTMQVEAKLKSALIVGVLKPGARLITKNIAAQLGTSVTPVREALLRLVSAGALDATPAQAFLVPSIAIEKYREITLIRKHLEGLAVTEVCARITSSELKELAILKDAFIAAKRANDIEATLEANRAFRFSLYGFAAMPTLTVLIEQLWIQIGPCFNYLYPQSNDWNERQHNYDALLTALAAKDTAAAVASIQKAISDGAAILEKQYFNL